MRCERGQAAIEWIGLVLLAALALGGAVAVAAPAVDGRSIGGLLAHRIACVARGGCDDGRRGLERTYGKRDAALLRRHAPGLVYEPGERQLPVDWRRCRRPDCASAPDDRDLDAHRTRAGRATVFTRVVRKSGRLYLQYWFYYPDSNTAFAGSDRLWERSLLARTAGRLIRGSSAYPGFHRDDWEGHHVRIDRRGRVEVRSTSHGHYQYCKWSRCRSRWGPATGWTRVSRGSHAGHVPVGRLGDRRLPGRRLRERTSTSDALRLIPLESLDRSGYRALDGGIEPPWRKRVFHDPEDDSS